MQLDLKKFRTYAGDCRSPIVLLSFAFITQLAITVS